MTGDQGLTDYADQMRLEYAYSKPQGLVPLAGTHQFVTANHMTPLSNWHALRLSWQWQCG